MAHSPPEVFTVHTLRQVAQEDKLFRRYLDKALGDGWDRDSQRPVRVEFWNDERDFLQATVSWHS